MASPLQGAEGDQFASMLKNMEISLPGIDEASTFAHIVKCVRKKF
jgi:hypothetical protein